MSLSPKSAKTIGVFSPSSWVEKADIQASSKLCEDNGYRIFVHPQTYNRTHQSAGTPQEKLSAFIDLWNNPDIDIIWAAGGGNQALEWIDAIPYETLKKTSAKPVIGFSDVTALLNALYAHDHIPTIHGATFNRLYKINQPIQTFTLLDTPSAPIDLSGATILKPGEASGHLIGGNLSVFQYLPCTLPEGFWRGAILFLEECNEELSKIDRMMLHLKRTGVLKQINGLIFGQCHNLSDTGRPYGLSLNDIIKKHCANLDIPILMDAPFGHGDDLQPLPIGSPKKRLAIQPNAITLYSC